MYIAFLASSLEEEIKCGIFVSQCSNNYRLSPASGTTLLCKMRLVNDKAVLSTPLVRLLNIIMLCEKLHRLHCNQ